MAAARRIQVDAVVGYACGVQGQVARAAHARGRDGGRAHARCRQQRNRLARARGDRVHRQRAPRLDHHLAGGAQQDVLPAGRLQGQRRGGRGRAQGVRLESPGDDHVRRVQVDIVARQIQVRGRADAARRADVAVDLHRVARLGRDVVGHHIARDRDVPVHLHTVPGDGEHVARDQIAPHRHVARGVDVSRHVHALSALGPDRVRDHAPGGREVAAE